MRFGGLGNEGHFVGVGVLSEGEWCCEEMLWLLSVVQGVGLWISCNLQMMRWLLEILWKMSEGATKAERADICINKPIKLCQVLWMMAL